MNYYYYNYYFYMELNFSYLYIKQNQRTCRSEGYIIITKIVHFTCVFTRHIYISCRLSISSRVDMFTLPNFPCKALSSLEQILCKIFPDGIQYLGNFEVYGVHLCRGFHRPVFLHQVQKSYLPILSATLLVTTNVFTPRSLLCQCNLQ